MIAEAKPDVLIVAGPRPFPPRSSMRNMPAFCIGAGRVTGWGDWDTIAGEIPTLPAFARHLHRSLLASDFDPSSSYDMPIDHGLTQPLELCDIPSSLPIVPIIVNANAPPRPSLRRCYALGVALRNAVTAFPENIRVAAIGSAACRIRRRPAISSMRRPLPSSASFTARKPYATMRPAGSNTS